MFDYQEGLTKIYNRFNNPNDDFETFTRFRKMHVELDYAVAASYGWLDLNLGHDFYTVTASGGTIQYTISEAARREVLSRLLELNHERYEEEARAGLHDKKSKGKGEKGSGGQGKKKGRGVKEKKGQYELF